MNNKNISASDNIVLYYGDTHPSIFSFKSKIGRLYKTNKRLEFKGEDVELDLSSLVESKLVAKKIRPIDYLIQWQVITTLVFLNTYITGADPIIAPVYGLLALPLIYGVTRLGQRVVKVAYKEKGQDKEAYFSNFRGMTFDHFRDFSERKKGK